MRGSNLTTAMKTFPLEPAPFDEHIVNRSSQSEHNSYRGSPVRSHFRTKIAKKIYSGSDRAILVILLCNMQAPSSSTFPGDDDAFYVEPIYPDDVIYNPHTLCHYVHPMQSPFPLTLKHNAFHVRHQPVDFRPFAWIPFQAPRNDLVDPVPSAYRTPEIIFPHGIH